MSADEFAARDETGPSHRIVIDVEDRGGATWVRFSQFGELRGLVGLASPRRAEVVPYVVAQSEPAPGRGSGVRGRVRGRLRGWGRCW